MAAYGPVTMLFSMWKANTELAGYAQQGMFRCFVMLCTLLKALDSPYHLPR